MKTDLSKERNFWFFIVTLLSLGVALSYLLHKLIERFIHWEYLHFFHAFTIPMAYSFLLWIFDNYAWKWRIFKLLKIVDFPNLNGQWKGSYVSCYKDKKGKPMIGVADLNIQQTASKISIRGKFKESESISLHATFGANELKNKISLFYFFRNVPKASARETMHAHEGSAILTYDKNNNELEGTYYSGRDRNNYGTITVKKVK